jgi:S-DNA-T family DNA segregation ATPase FtsK/SpoIIIE
MQQNQKTFSKNTVKEEPVTAQPKEKKTAAPKEKVSKPAKAKNSNSRPLLPGIISFLKSENFKKVTGLFLLLFAFFLIIAFISYLFTWKADDNIFYNSFIRVLTDNNLTSENWMGKIGAILSFLFIKKWFGIASFLFIVWLIVFGVRMFIQTRLFPLKKTTYYLIFSLLWISITISSIINSEQLLIFGGTFGYQANIWLNSILGKIGTGILLFFLLFSFLILEFNIMRKRMKSESIEDELEEEQTTTERNNIRNEYKIDHLSIQDNETTNEEEDVEISLISKPLETETKEDLTIAPIIEKPEESDAVPFTVNEESDDSDLAASVETENEIDSTKHFGLNTPFDPTLDLPDFKFPSVDLLKEYDSGNIAVQTEELEANKNKILKTLNNYSIQIDKINATIGPTVTLYEIVPAPGVRISKIKYLEDDIALSLSALGIRIIAPMPGKGTIGIEVPNQNPKIVSMKSILTSEAFQNNSYDLPIGLGKTISNKSFVADLAKMPHLLMAGATGQGKSVGLNAILTSLLYKKHPSQLKFVLVDPKKVELTLFSKIERHYLAKLPDAEEAIITDIRKVVRTLNSLCIEMDSRYDLLKMAGVRNIKEYNTKFIARKLNPNDGHHFLPYIVLIVDEFADLIITAGKEVETPMARLAQLARAIGIHLIVATQRPSVNVITGTIKANFPARVAYRVISKIDSRTILDSSGADQLIGRGDMLLSTGSEMVRLQCAFIDTPEVEEITDFIGNQRGYPGAYELPECPDEESENIKNLDPSERDEMFEEAARVIVAHQHGSTSLLQRKLKLGYNRAGRIIDQLEAAGIVGPFEGSKARDVKITDMNTLEQFLNDYKNTNI